MDQNAPLLRDDHPLRISGVLTCSLNNGEGIRYVIFCQGCLHHCEGCHNPETWDFHGGYEVTTEELLQDITKRKHLDGITLSGGDPFFQQHACVNLLQNLPKHLNVWIYTGFQYEDIQHTKLAQLADYIVDGKFEQEKKVEGEMYGSSNQRIIKVGGN